MEMTPEIVRKIQLIELEMLCKVDVICRKHSIPYMICGGTLLGAVRHKGFIPWDDDIDIEMMRKDYEKFLLIAPKELPCNYFVQNYKTEKNCVTPKFTKIRINGTLQETKSLQNINCHKGIGIDIFPLDAFPLDISKKNMRKKIINALVYILWRKLKINYHNQNFFKKIIAQILSIILKPIPMYSLGKCIEKVMRLYENTDNALITKKHIFDKSLYENITYLEFEGYKFPAPKEWDTFLKRSYGDYMKLPPEEKRWNYHKIVNVSFNTDIKNNA